MYIPVHNSGRFGLVTDIPDHELPPEAWSYSQNIRFRDGFAESVIGYDDPYDGIITNASRRHIFQLRQADAVYWIAAGGTKVDVSDGSGVTKSIYNPLVGNPSVDDFTSTIQAGLAILNHNGQAPLYWNGDFATPTQMADLLNWPANTTAGALRSFGNFLVALDITKTGTRFPYMVKWSSPADPGTLPGSWDETDATELAGEHDLGDSGGILLDSLQLGRVNIIYKEDAIHTQQFIRGVLVFRFDELTRTVGTLGRNTIANIRGGQTSMGFEDIVQVTSSNVTSLLKSRLRRWYEANLDGDNYKNSFVVVDESRDEIWYCFPGTGSSDCTLAILWNQVENTLAVRDLPDISHAAWGVFAITSDETWDADSTTWDSDNTIWNEVLFNSARQGILAVQNGQTNPNRMFRMDGGPPNTASNYPTVASPFSILERTGLALAGRDRNGNPKVDWTTKKLFKGLRPRIDASSSIQVSVGVQQLKDGPVEWNTPQTYDPGSNFKLDFTLNGRALAVRFQAESDTYWKLHGFDVDVEQAGEY